MDHGSRIMDHGSWIMDHGSWIMDHGSCCSARAAMGCSTHLPSTNFVHITSSAQSIRSAIISNESHLFQPLLWSRPSQFWSFRASPAIIETSHHREHSTAQHSTAQHSTAQHSTTQLPMIRSFVLTSCILQKQLITLCMSVPDR